VNGASSGDSHITTHVPAVLMVPSFVCQSGGGTVDPILHVKWLAVAQARLAS